MFACSWCHERYYTPRGRDGVGGKGVWEMGGGIALHSWNRGWYCGDVGMGGG